MSNISKEDLLKKIQSLEKELEELKNQREEEKTSPLLFSSGTSSLRKDQKEELSERIDKTVDLIFRYYKEVVKK